MAPPKKPPKPDASLFFKQKSGTPKPPRKDKTSQSQDHEESESGSDSDQRTSLRNDLKAWFKEIKQSFHEELQSAMKGLPNLRKYQHSLSNS
ncbi:hypothetical protein FKM82_017254 [Ascaphus truei]